MAVLSNVTAPGAAPQLRELEDAALGLGLRFRVHVVRAPEELAPAFAAAVRDGAQGVLTGNESIFINQRVLVAELAVRHRLPSVHPCDVITDAYVDRILKGAWLADVPVE